MKLGVIGVDTLNQYEKLYYTFLMEISSYHDILKSKRNVDVCLCSFNDQSTKNYIKNKDKYPYSYNDYGIVDYLDPSIDFYHISELNPKNDDEDVKSKLIDIIKTKKPIIYTDSDGEYSNRKLGGWCIKLPVGAFLLQNAPVGQVTIHSTCKTFAHDYRVDFKSKVFYCPYVLSEGMQKAFSPKSEVPKTDDFVYVGSLTGRPYMTQFFEEIAKEGFNVSLALYHFDRMKISGDWYTPIHDYVGLKFSRSDYFTFLSKFKYAFVGSGWFMKRDRPTTAMIQNPSYSTFRLIEPILTNQLPISYITPELEDAGILQELLIEWQGFKDCSNLFRKIEILKYFRDHQTIYTTFQVDTVKKLNSMFGPQSPHASSVPEVFGL